MLELDGELVTVKTVDENTTELVEYINNYCEENNITNNQGEVIYVEANQGSPLYLLCRGIGYQTNIIQNLLKSAAASISIGESSDLQLLNLAAIAGIQRKSATKTTIATIVYALEDTDCPITTSLTVTVSTDDGNVVFSPAYDTTITANTSQYIILIASSYGSYNISENTLSQFDENPTGFLKMTNFTSVPGQDQESIASLRRRILMRQTQETWLTKIEEAIASLDGVSWCSAYYNSTSDTQTINGTEVESRHVLLTIQGYSDAIAETYLQYSCAPTTGTSSERCLSQDYTLQIGQTLTIYFLTPEYVSPYINVYTQLSLAESDQLVIKQCIALLAQQISVGQGLTSVEVINQIQDNLNFIIDGVTLSLDGETYDYQIGVESDQLLTFDNSLITVTQSI